MIFTAPPEHTLEWSDSGVEGSFRFLKRVWSFAVEARPLVEPKSATARFDWSHASDALRAARREIHLALKQANIDFARLQFNTVASAAMKMLNALEKVPRLDEAGTPAARALVSEGLGILLRLLAPITPHVAHVLWRELGYGEDVSSASWPEHDEDALAQASIEIVVQVNGKLRGRVAVPAHAGEDEVRALALADAAVARHVGDKTVRKTVYVPGKLINLVV